jgi:hypothetical protein
MSFETFIETAWNDHADAPQLVADRLAASFALVQSTGQAAPFARLLTHVFGEHLGEWARGAALLDTLASLSVVGADADTARVIARHAATLRYGGGDGAALAALSTDDRIAALATAASAFAARKEYKRALAAYDDALLAAASGLADDSPAIKALAVGGNNLAAALEEATGRDAAETKSMVRAAEAGLVWWRRAGTWLEEERAEYRLARSLLQAGDAAAAPQHAARCVEVCAKNDAPAFERFFGHAVLALAQRARGDSAGFEDTRGRASLLFAQLPADEQGWCKAELDELGAARGN